MTELLRPYLGGTPLAPEQLKSISTYIDILSLWNTKMNLTAIRDPEEMVRRHFGESLFAARILLAPDARITAADVGSGAGFPGIPMKIHAPGLKMTLIEAHGKKATFLREILRSIKLTDIDVFQGRTENWRRTADLVVLRAVERFEAILPAAAGLVGDGGRLGILIGESQASVARKLLKGDWQDPVPIPESSKRVVHVWVKG